MSLTTATWQATAAGRKAAQQASIDALNFKVPTVPDSTLNVAKLSLADQLSPQDIEITEASHGVSGLLEKLASGTWSSEAVVGAFARRSIIAHKLTNCLTEVFIDQALLRAKMLDKHLADTGKPIGPLHGLPISLKDQICVEGVECNMGYVGWVGRVSKENAVLVTLLLEQGAVIYVHTNIPQSLMLTETVNAVYGTTTNPYNRALSCGGSSGGEGALIAMKGSPLGVGSDVGGSIRIPSAFNGLYGLRPSYNRIPYCGSVNSMEGFEAIPSVLGPISSTVDGLKIFMKAVLDAKPWRFDPIALHMPWNEEAYSLSEHGSGGKLCFAFMRDDGVARPMPPYFRAFEMLQAALKLAGHSVIEFAFPEPVASYDLVVRINADGGTDIDASCALSGEPRTGWLRPAEAPKHLSTFEYWQLLKERKEFLRRQLDAWEATSSLTGTGRPVDAIIAPISAHLPERHGQAQLVLLPLLFPAKRPDVPNDRYLSYTTMCNIADYPTGVFPVTSCDPTIDVKEAPLAFRGPEDEMVYNLYEPEVYRDAPVSLQCIGRKGEDEAVVRMTEILDAALKAVKA
ncbi:amidase, partial [Phenoliferia sp. Uapishka_3]